MAVAARDLLNAGNTTINNILLTQIGQLKMTSEQFLVWVNLRMYQEQGINFPSTHELVQNTGFSEEKLYQILQDLIEQNFIKLISQTRPGTPYQDCYDLTPTYEKLLERDVAQATEPTPSADSNQLQRIFQQIEVEFGRPLSPIEQQVIQGWLTQDHYSVELIQLALKESVLNQVYSLKYIDRILLNWEKHNIKTVAQLQRYKEQQGDY
ncbi:DnaD domain protein [Bombilactobacillus folatiphilus]|uniref:DnaD domain protein n=1 Tax=Bombilactobacillus folatiphilus TaxID=2923362 RepID=A0ABY4P761_9LACO|nr:DnaD domain protein [Bombilactobacillus folatiphilus]UQS81482.1 DnaD domain protein [Bombilactobacillus folatiphilus]